MQPGPTLDRILAVNVLKLPDNDHYPRFSTDLNAAWYLVEAFRGRRPKVEIAFVDPDRYEAQLHLSVGEVDPVYKAEGETPAHALALAVLQAAKA